MNPALVPLLQAVIPLGIDAIMRVVDIAIKEKTVGLTADDWRGLLRYISSLEANLDEVLRNEQPHN